jgi:hypothetical protein
MTSLIVIIIKATVRIVFSDKEKLSALCQMLKLFATGLVKK